MIAQYEAAGRDPLLSAPRQYCLTQAHKHLPEMKVITGLEREPVFCPIVADFYSGMAVTVPLFQEQLSRGCGAEEIKNVYSSLYRGPVVSWREDPSEEGFFSANALSGSDRMEITIQGNEQRLLLMARYDNLGKGASGAALECMNLVLGDPEDKGLE